MPLATDQPEPLLIRVQEAAHLLGIGRTTVNELIREGRLGAVKINRTTRIPKSEIEDFIQRHSRKSAAEA